MSSANSYIDPPPRLDLPLTPKANLLLSSLPQDEYDRLLPHMEMIPFKLKEQFYSPNVPIRHAYFPLTCVGSLINILEDGGSVEFGTVGYEGFIGLPVILGTQSIPTLAICQIAGDAVRIKAEFLQDEMNRLGPLHQLLLRYTQALFNQVAQTAACNRLHPIEERCSRWLLMTHDRVGRDEFTLTQEFLATMLGVRRATVTVAAGILQEAGLIRYRRGSITIVDRESLEDSSCDCYRVIRREFDRLLK